MLERIQQFIEEFSEKQFLLYTAVFFGALLMAMGSIFYVQRSSRADLIKKISKVNKQRQEVQELLSTYEKVKQQQAEVAALLEKDKSFKIVGFFDALLQAQGLSSHKTNLSQSEEHLEYLPEYNEIRLVITLTGLNTKQLAELLRALEQHERVYTKALEIAQARNAIDATLTIATLQHRVTEGG